MRQQFLFLVWCCLKSPTQRSRETQNGCEGTGTERERERLRGRLGVAIFENVRFQTG